MATVHQTQPTIQLLLGSNEFVGALDLISTTQEVLTQELPGVQCFRYGSLKLFLMFILALTHASHVQMRRVPIGHDTLIQCCLDIGQTS